MTSLDYALRYAALGWPVFRVWGAADGACVCQLAPEGMPTKKDHSPDKNGRAKGSPGKHPVVGQSEATTDEATLRSWFAGAFQPGLAMACGLASGVWVLDVDPRNGGHDSLARLVAEYGPLPPGPAARTGGGGLHLFFRWPSHGKLPRRRVGPGLDVITGDSPYLILPPSTHVSGGAYAWIVPPWEVE